MHSHLKLPLSILTQFLFLSLGSSRAGDLSGIVRAHGKELPVHSPSSGLYESRKFKFVERVDYSHMEDFVVFIDQPMSVKPVPPKLPVEVITQKDATFKPHVLPIVVGTTVRWPNHDEIYHNVFSFSEPKQFDLGFYKSETNKVVTFDQHGQVDALCSIHTQMHCIILVMENSFYAVTDARGGYTITNIPAGTYRFKAWHERMPPEVKNVVIPETGKVVMNFDLGIKGLPTY